MTWVDEWGTLDRKPYRTSKKRWSDRTTRTSGTTSGRRSRSCTRKRTRRQTPDFGHGSRSRPENDRSRSAEVSRVGCRVACVGCRVACVVIGFERRRDVGGARREPVCGNRSGSEGTPEQERWRDRSIVRSRAGRGIEWTPIRRNGAVGGWRRNPVASRSRFDVNRSISFDYE